MGQSIEPWRLSTRAAQVKQFPRYTFAGDDFHVLSIPCLTRLHDWLGIIAGNTMEAVCCFEKSTEMNEPMQCRDYISWNLREYAPTNDRTSCFGSCYRRSYRQCHKIKNLNGSIAAIYSHVNACCCFVSTQVAIANNAFLLQKNARKRLSNSVWPSISQAVYRSYAAARGASTQ